MRSFLRLLLPLLLAGSPLAHSQNGTVQTVVISGTAAPIGGDFTTFATPVINGSGNVAFVGNTASSTAVYKTNGPSLVTIVKKGDAAPVIGGPFTDFLSPLLNESGTVAFFGNNGVYVLGLQKGGLYTGTGGALTTIAAYSETNAALGLPGPTTVVTELPKQASLADNGIVAFKAIVNTNGTVEATDPHGLFFGTGGGLSSATSLAIKGTAVSGITFTFLGDVVQNNVGLSLITGTVGTTTNGLYTKSGASLNTIATTLQASPMGGNFTNVSASGLNDQGRVAFLGSSSGGSGIFTGSGGALTPIATTTSAAPGLGGNFIYFEQTVISNSGLVSFMAWGSVAGTKAIYSGSGGTLKTVATTLQTAPMIGGNFNAFSNIATNDLGTVAFIGTNSTAGVQGLYLGDGQEIITAAFTGQSVSDSTISSGGIFFQGGADRGGSSQINNNGQITYLANLANGKKTVLLFTPTLRFRTPTSGSWATRTNWTVGILPASVHDVVIDPTSALAITGPTLPTTVKSLTVGTSAGGAAEITLQSAGTITATAGVTSLTTGRIRGNGRLIGNLSNAGILAPGLPSAAGLITITGNVTLQATSQLALDLGGLVRKTNYDYLSISGSLSLGGSLNLSLLSGFTPLLGHSFDLFDAASTTGSFGTLNLPSLTAGLGWNTSLLTSTGVISVVSTGPVIANWNVSGAGSWSSAGNWVPTIPNASGAAATFGPAAVSPTTVSVSGAKTVGSISFNSANSYLVTGGPTDTITLDDSSTTPSVSVTTGSHTISAPLVLAQNASASTAAGTTLTLTGNISGASRSLTKTGTGILNLDGTQSYAALLASAGTTNVDGTVGTGTSSVSVSGAGTVLKFGSVSQTLSSLTIGAGSTVTFTSGAASFTDGGGKVQNPGGSAAVPEPGSVGLLLTAVLGLLARRRRLAAE